MLSEDALATVAIQRPKAHVGASLFGFQNQLLLCVAIALVVPAEIKIGGMTVFDLCAYPVLIFSLIRGTLVRRPSKRWGAVELGLLGLVAVSLLAYCANYDQFGGQKSFIESLELSTDFLFLRLSAYGLMTLFLIFGYFRVTRRETFTERDLTKILTVICVAGSLNAVVTIVEWVKQTGGVFSRYNYMPPIEMSPGIHADRMCFVFLLAFSAWLTGPKGALRPITLVTMLLTFGSLLSGMVRQAWALFVLQILIFAFFSWVDRTVRAKIRIFALLISAGFLIGGAYVILTQYHDLALLFSDSSSVNIRRSLWENGVGVFQANPLVGVGYGHYILYSTRLISVTNADVAVSSAHNGVVMVAAETGAAGLCFFALVCWGMLSISSKAMKKAEGPLGRATTRAAQVLLIIALISQFVSNTLILPLPVERLMVHEAFLLWFLVALCAGISDHPQMSTMAS